MKGMLDLGRMGEKLSGILKGDKKVKIIMAIGLIGILLIALSELVPSGSKKAENGDVVVITADQYADELEKQLHEIIGSIEGAGTCKVLVTLESGVEYIYAKEEKSSSDKTEDQQSADQSKTQTKDSFENNMVIIDTGDGEQALVSKEVQPKIRGVVVVCAGGDNLSVQQRVINAVTTALDVSSARVFVTRMGAQ